MIRLAVVGVGGYGWGLITKLAQLARPCACRVVAAADWRLAALGERAARLRAQGVRLYHDAAEMLEDLRGRCEAVYIASGIPTHAPLTIAAARCGYHVHLEKPPAATVQEMDEMLAALRQANRMCLVGFQALHGDLRLGIDRLAAGRLGRARTLTCSAGWPRPRPYYRRNEWAGRLRSDAGWVLDGPATNALSHQLAHMLAMAAGRRHAFAAPLAVRAELYAAGPVESHNLAAIEVRTAEGPILRFYCSHATAGTFGPAIHVACDRGRAVYDQRDGTTVAYDDGTQEHQPSQADDQEEMIANFLEAVRCGEASHLRCGLAQTRNYVLAVNGAHESSRRVHRIDERYWRLQDAGTDDQRVVVDGLDELLVAAEREGKLLSDLDGAPRWAVATEPFDLTGYDRFPQRFRCD
jgi:predicted dehydrogenase